MPTCLAPPCPLDAASFVLAGRVPLRCCLLTVWSTGPAGFAARAVLLDGTLRDFTSPFELARFLGSPMAASEAPAPGNPGWREGQKGTVHFLRSVLADLACTVEEIYECNAEVVACRCALRGVQQGPFLNLSAVSAPIELMTMESHHFEGDRIVCTGHIEDFFGVYLQLLAAGAKPVNDKARAKRHCRHRPTTDSA